MDNLDKYLEPATVIDSNHKIVIEYTESILANSNLNDEEKAVKLYYRVRDDIRYDPYVSFYKDEHYRSSNVIKAGKGFCIHKAGLLCATARAAGIPSRVGFATVRNHLSTKQLLDYMGTDVFSFHGYTEFWLKERWVKATPAFNIELCQIMGVAPLEFNGVDDSVFQQHKSDNEKFMEYLNYHGEFHDIPVNLILEDWKKVYGAEELEKWIDFLEKNNGASGRDFSREDII